MVDFIRFPELRDSQLAFYYWESPHKQILENFDARVIKVTDGDTIRVETDFRDFDFPIRMSEINAPELNETGGKESQRWLESQIIGKDISVVINPRNRVGKWGRILGKVISEGIDMNEEIMRVGHATTFESRNEGKIPEFNASLARATI